MPSTPETAAPAGVDFFTATLDLQEKLRGLPADERGQMLKAFKKVAPHMSTKKALLLFGSLRAVYDTLYGALSEGITEKESNKLGEEFRAKARTTRKKLAASGEVVDSESMCRALGVTRQALNKALQAHRIFALTMESGANCYPAFYANPKLDRRVLERVSKRLGALPGWSKWQFFTTRRASLQGLTPLHALQKGKVQAVLDAAAGFAER